MQHWQRLVGMFAIVALGFAAASAAPVGFDDSVTWWRFANDLTDSNAPASNGTLVNGAVSYAAVSGAGAYSNGVAAAFNGDRIHVPAGAGTELDTDGFGGLTTFIRVDPDVRSGTGGQCVLNRDGYDSAERVFSLEIGNTATQGRVLWRPGATAPVGPST